MCGTEKNKSSQHNHFICVIIKVENHIITHVRATNSDKKIGPLNAGNLYLDTALRSLQQNMLFLEFAFKLKCPKKDYWYKLKRIFGKWQRSFTRFVNKRTQLAIIWVLFMEKILLSCSHLNATVNATFVFLNLFFTLNLILKLRDHTVYLAFIMQICFHLWHVELSQKAKYSNL